ncbi:MAG: hypothetical protein D6832_03520, partial [Alphaproteobacteria bacterium]
GLASALVAATLATAAPASAGSFCDAVRAPVTNLIALGAAGTAGASAALGATGFYATGGPGAALGSTLPGVSAAGTVGFVPGSGGLIGGALATLASPVTLFLAGGLALTYGAAYGACAAID